MSKEITNIKKQMIDELIKIEGGYVNDKKDSGGATKYGITEAVARKYGFQGNMKYLSYETAYDIYEMTSDNGSTIGYCDLTQYSSIPTAGAFEVTFAARPNNVVGEYRTCAKYWVHWAVGYNGSSVVARIETVQAFKSTLTISSSLSLSAVFVDQATQTVENTEISAPSALATNYIRLKISGFGAGGPNQQVRLRIRDEFGSQELITKYVTSY